MTDLLTLQNLMFGGLFADLIVAGVSAFLIVAGCARVAEQTAEVASAPAMVVVRAPQDRVSTSDQISRLTRIITDATEQMQSVAGHQAAASIRIDAAELAFNRLLLDIGAVMPLNVRPTVIGRDLY